MGNQKTTLKRKKKAVKLKGNRKIHRIVKDIETSIWNNQKLSKVQRMYDIITDLKVENAYYENNPIIEHAIIKWQDKLKRIGE